MAFPNPVQLLTQEAALTPSPGREQDGDISDLRACAEEWCLLALALSLEPSIYAVTHKDAC